MITMENSITGHTINVKQGWSWTCFFFHLLVLLVRGQYKDAGLFFGYWFILSISTGILVNVAHLTYVGPMIFNVFMLLGMFFLGFKANERRISMLESKGYQKKL